MSVRALNRALLARQWLLQRERRAPEEALEHLVGMQAQSPDPPYIGLWTRLDTFDPATLADLIVTRQAVRIALMRSTIHLVTTHDAAALRLLMQPQLDRALEAMLRKGLAGVARDALADAARQLVEARPLTVIELGAALQQRWPDADARLLANAARVIVPMVQVPPRGVWGTTGPAAYTTLTHWLGTSRRAKASKVPPSANHPQTLEGLLWRYFGAFGPATIADARVWSGLTRLDDALERLRPRLRLFRDEQGRELFDQPDAPRPDEAVEAPPRFLPEFDNLLLSHDDRARVMTPSHRERVGATGGMVPATFLIDGLVHGVWRIERPRSRRQSTVLRITPFARLRNADRDALSAEGERLLRFAAPESAHDLQFETV